MVTTSAETMSVGGDGMGEGAATVMGGADGDGDGGSLVRAQAAMGRRNNIRDRGFMGVLLREPAGTHARQAPFLRY
jgi:hypothetical protein